jgi:hypothetical protein
LNLVRRLSLCLTLSAMSGCAAVSTVPVNSYCAIARPLGYNGKTDTAKTVKEIEAHNSRWACVCDNDCPTTAPNTK